MKRTIRMRGICASPGIAMGPVRIVDRQQIRIPKVRLKTYQLELETSRFLDALAESRAQLEEAREAIPAADVIMHGAVTSTGPSDYSLILEAHLLMLDDEMLVDGVSSLIKNEKINAEWALSKKTEEIKSMLAGLGDDYFKERAQDVDFVGVRVLRNLLGHVTEIVDDQGDPCIIIADNLSPAETSQMVGAPVLAFSTEAGTRTSHTAIIAQALGIPAVVGVEKLTERISYGDIVIIDGNEGVVLIRPDEATIVDYKDRAARHAELEKAHLACRDEPARTTDGLDCNLMANIEFPAEAAMAMDYGAKGVGLYRTEFLFIDRPVLPDEEEQYRTYRTVVEAVAPNPAIFRTFDLGADKVSTDFKHHEANPALGLRAIRLGLKNRSMFKTQLKALLRASEHGDLRIMFPLISGVGELRQVKAVLDEAYRDLECTKGVPIGCMIELPSAVMVADLLAQEVDFFSIGTNDLIQYSMAIDRANDHVAYLYTPFHPAILRAVKATLEAGKNAGIAVSMCGGMASEPMLVPVLLGLGLNSLSMAPTLIPTIKTMVCAINSIEASEVAEKVLTLSTATEIEDYVRGYVKSKVDPILG